MFGNYGLRSGAPFRYCVECETIFEKTDNILFSTILVVVCSENREEDYPRGNVVYSLLFFREMRKKESESERNDNTPHAERKDAKIQLHQGCFQLSIYQRSGNLNGITRILNIIDRDQGNQEEKFRKKKKS